MKIKTWIVYLYEIVLIIILIWGKGGVHTFLKFYWIICIWLSYLCQLSLKFWLNKHIFNTNPLNNGQEVVLSWKPFFLKYSLSIEYANTKEQAFAGHAIFSCLSESCDILNSTSKFTGYAFFFFTDDTKPCLC